MGSDPHGDPAAFPLWGEAWSGVITNYKSGNELLNAKLSPQHFFIKILAIAPSGGYHPLTKSQIWPKGGPAGIKRIWGERPTILLPSVAASAVRAWFFQLNALVDSSRVRGFLAVREEEKVLVQGLNTPFADGILGIKVTHVEL